MARWFSRVLQGSAPAAAEPVPFSLTCRCGSVVSGIRGERMHVAVCRECRFQICVLPVSPYPRPKVRAPKKKTPKPSVLRDTVEPDVRTPPPSANRSSRSVGGAKPSEVKKSTRADSKPQEEIRREKSPFAIPRRRIVTPLRLIAVGMIGVVTLAGWWVVHRRAVAQAVVIFAEATKAGRAALAESDFDLADLQLQRAVSALELLGRDDRDARQVRQLAREATAARGLALSSLFELIGEARSARKISAANWQQTIKHNYQGRWFLVETNGLLLTTGDPPQWQFSVPLIPGTEPLQISGDLTNWSRLFGSTPPTQVILAGQLDEIRPLAGDQGLEIVLKKETLCLWTNPDVYSALGGTLDDGSRATLTSQAQLLGVTE